MPAKTTILSPTYPQNIYFINKTAIFISKTLDKSNKMLYICTIKNQKSKTMNKAELIDAIASGAKLTKADAAKAIDATIEAITKALKKGDRVQLIGFGSFSVTKRSARTGRNPQTGKEIKIPMPFFIINIIPVLNNLRAPSRFNIMMMLSLAILAALAIRFILLNIRKPWPKFGAALFITVLISFEYLAIPFPMFKVMPPPIYHAIGQEKEKGTILDIPLGWQDGFKQIGSEKNQAQLMYLQIFHQKRIFGAYLARIPDAKIEYFCSLPIFSSIIKLQEIGYQPEVIDLVKERNLAEDFINKYDLSYIVIHRPYLDSLVHEYILEVFSLEKYYEDRKLIIYKIKEGETSVKRELPELFSESVNLSSLQTVVAEGSPFHARGNIRFRKTEIIQIGGLEPKSFSRLDISLDSNDIYEIAFKRGGRELRKFWIGPKELPERAMARYVIEIHPPVELADSMTIRGLHGDKYYFLGHILLE